VMCSQGRLTWESTAERGPWWPIQVNDPVAVNVGEEVPTWSSHDGEFLISLQVVTVDVHFLFVLVMPEIVPYYYMT